MENQCRTLMGHDEKPPKERCPILSGQQGGLEENMVKH